MTPGEMFTQKMPCEALSWAGAGNTVRPAAFTTA